MIAHRVEHFGPWSAALAVALAFVLFVLAGIYTVRQQEHVNKRLCESTVINRKSARASWLALQRLTLANIDSDESASEQEKELRRARINDFIFVVLKPIPALECVDNQPVPRGGD